MKTLTSLISRFVNLPEEVVKYFVRCRVHFRVRNLNREVIGGRRSKKRKLNNSQDRVECKIKHILYT